MVDIRLDDESMAAVASKAIFDSISQEAREKVMKDAIKGLIEPKRDGNSYSYGYGKSPLQMAFESAIQRAATQAVEEKIASDPELAQAIQDMLGPIIHGALKAESEKYDHSLADKIGQAVGQWLSEKARESR